MAPCEAGIKAISVRGRMALAERKFIEDQVYLYLYLHLYLLQPPGQAGVSNGSMTCVGPGIP